MGALRCNEKAAALVVDAKVVELSCTEAGIAKLATVRRAS
jgi:hypothetical protein